MSTETNSESILQKENPPVIKKSPNIPNNKNYKKSEDLNNREEEKIEKITSIRNKKKLENNSNNNKLDSSSITSNGNKKLNNNNNNSNLIQINGNFSFSKIKKIIPKNNNNDKNITKTKPNNARTASAVYLRKNDINGNNHNLINENEVDSSSGKKKELKNNKTKTNLTNLNNKTTNNNTNNKTSTNLAKKKDLLNNSYISKKIYNNRRSSCGDAVDLRKKEKENDLEQKSGEVLKGKNFDELYERLTKHKTKIRGKVENMKKKFEDEELKQLKNTPNINKSSKYYEKDSEDFLKRVEIYKFVSKAKRIELVEKDEKKLEEELNKNPKLKKKMKLDEIQKIIDEKLKSDKLKKLEKEQKMQQMKRNYEESKLAECTFVPEISENSKKMDVSFKRNVCKMTKSSSVPRFLETENKSVYLDSSQAINYNKIQNNNLKEKKAKFNIKTTLNTNNSTNNIFAKQTTRNSNNKSYSRNNNNEGFRESHSMNRLPDTSGNRINSSNVFLNLSSLNETMVKEENKSISGLPMNVSKKESDIIKELLRNKYNF